MTDDPTPAQPAIEEPKMEIHKPHAAKSWKEFFIELGTIVIGILIALGLEQAVEGFHDRTRAAEARGNIRSEIAANLGSIGVRNTVEGCISSRMNEVDGLIRASVAGSLPKGPIWVGHPFLSAMTDNQYRSANQSGAVSLMGSPEQAGYALIYVGFDQYRQAGQREVAAWADLRTLENHPANTAVLDWQLRSAMQQARTARFQMETAEYGIRNQASQLGITPNSSTTFPRQSTCIPLATSRADGEKMEFEGQRHPIHYDVP